MAPIRQHRRKSSAHPISRCRWSRNDARDRLIGSFLLLFVLGVPVSLAIGTSRPGRHPRSATIRSSISRATDERDQIPSSCWPSRFSSSPATCSISAAPPRGCSRSAKRCSPASPADWPSHHHGANVVFSGMSGAALADIAASARSSAARCVAPATASPSPPPRSLRAPSRPDDPALDHVHHLCGVDEYLGRPPVPRGRRGGNCSSPSCS